MHYYLRTQSNNMVRRSKHLPAMRYYKHIAVFIAQFNKQPPNMLTVSRVQLNDGFHIQVELGYKDNHLFRTENKVLIFRLINREINLNPFQHSVLPRNGEQDKAKGIFLLTSKDSHPDCHSLISKNNK